VFEYQADSEFIHRISQDFCKPEALLGPAPFIHHRLSLTIADGFIGVRFRPISANTHAYLQAVHDDITVGRNQADQHIAWLGTMLQNIAQSSIATNSDSRLLTGCLDAVIEIFHPKGLTIACLFMLVADFTHRMEAATQDIWLQLYGEIMAHNCGTPYEEWDLLERLCFCWFMARGEDSSLDDLKLINHQKMNSEDLVLGLRDRQPQDFVAFLQLSAVLDHVRLEYIESPDSTLLFLRNSVTEQMAILRTGQWASKHAKKEYMWTKSKGKVPLSEGGMFMVAKWNPEKEK
jgi:hypothetical protein